MAREFGTSDWIQYGHVSAFDATAMLSISFWKYSMTGGSSYSGPFFQMGAEGTGTGTASGIEMYNNDLDETQMLFSHRNNNGAEGSRTPAAAITANVWEHVYAVYDGTQAVNADRVKVWLNGSPLSMTHFDTHPTRLGTTNQPLQLGRKEGGNYWNGRLAEFGCWLDADVTRGPGLAGRHAPSFYSSNLRVYLPLISGDGAVDVKGDAGTPTITGTTEVAHPPGISYPPRPTPSQWRKRRASWSVSSPGGYF